MKFDVNKAATRAWEYCGQESFNKCSPSKQAKVMEKVRSGQDLHYVYKGQCVGVFRRTWAACGVNIPGMDGCGNPSAYMQLLMKNQNIYRQVGKAALDNPRYGDVVLYHGGETVGHGAIFLPIKGQGCWVSDAVQRGWDVYRSYGNGPKGTHDVMVFRFAGDVDGDGGNASFPDVGEDGGWMTAEGGVMDTRQALLDYCPDSIEFKGLWMRYHIWMGDRSPVLRAAKAGGFYSGGFGSFTTSAGETGISTEMLNQICMWETSHNFGYTMPSRDLTGYNLGDAHGHVTFGYGLLYHPNGQFMDSIKRNWTQQELEQIYLTHVKQFADKVVSWAKKNNISLNQNQIDALVSATFNFGPGFLNRQVGRMVAANPNDPAIRSVWEHASDAQARKYRGLADRRRKEAAWYFGYR